MKKSTQASYVWASGSRLPQLLPWVTSFPLITLTHGFLPCLLNDLFMEPRPISKQNAPGELFQNSPHLTTAPFAPDTSAKRSFRHYGETLAKKNYHLFHPWSDTILYIPLLFPLSLPATSAPHFSATVSHRESTLCPLSTVHSVFPTSSPPYHSTIPEYLSFNLVTKSNAYSSLIILQVSTGMQAGNSVIYCSWFT